MEFSKRINQFFLLSRCLVRRLIWGRADKAPQNISKIILLPAGKLGDVVCNTPVLIALRKFLPQTHIIVAGATKLHYPLLADSGLVDEYLDLGIKGTIKRIRECRVQVALITGPSFESTIPFYLAGVPLVVAPVVQGGFSPTETRLYKILQKFIKTFPYNIESYAPRERLRVLEPLGIFADDTQKQLGFSKIADEKVEDFFRDNQIDSSKDFVVGISPSAGNKIKEWPVERFSQVADYLYEKYRAKLIIVGGKQDLVLAEKMLNNLDKKTIIVNSAGKFNLDELKAFISKLNLFIGVDTGPIYIAEAFCVPTIDIVGPVDERVQPPRGFIHRNVLPPNRIKPELSVLNARLYNKEEASAQVLSTTVVTVLEEIDKLINDLRKKNGH